MNDHDLKQPCSVLNELRDISHNAAKKNGWWDEPRNDGELMMLIVTEVAEATEGLRADDWENVAEEMADIIIRVLDFCGARNIDLGLATFRKIIKNRSRGHKHGGKKF